jgi:hypothetical protein
MLSSEPQLERYYQRETQPVAPDHEITVDGEPIRFVGFERRLERRLERASAPCGY